MKNISRLELGEIFNNENGKTCIYLISGTFLIFIGGLAFAYGVFTQHSESIMQSIVVIGIGAGLLGYNKTIQAKNDRAGVGMTSSTSSTETTTKDSKTIDTETIGSNNG